MGRKLRVLIVEDHPIDTELLVIQLRRAGFDPEVQQADTKAEYLQALESNPEVILCDFSLPDFSGMDALELLKERQLEIPFILISGTIGEDTALESIKRGATDYLLKDRLVRLGTAVEQALEQAKLKCERREDEEARRLFRNLVDQSNDTFEVIDPETGQYLDVNAKGPAETGYTREEYLKMRVWDLDPTVDRSIWPHLVNHVRSSPSTTALGCHRRKDGSTFPVEVSAKCVRLGREYMVATVRDITDRKNAESILQESERRFREMLENLDLIAITLDPEGIVTFCNDYLVQLTGWSREEILGSDWFNMFIPEGLKVKEMFFKTVPTGEIPAHYENPIRTRQGELRDITWNNTVLRDASGAIIGTASIGADVTERNRAVERIEEQASMLDHAHEAIIVRSIKDRSITFWNRGAERLYGWTAAEAVGRDIGALIFADPQQLESINEHMLKTGEAQGEFKQRTKDGKELVVRGHVTLIYDKKGTPSSALIINFDITEQKNLEARLLRSQRMESIGTLASGVAHDLNNILAPIRMAVPMLREELSAEQKQELLSIIELSAERGTEIIKQVLTFGRGMQGERRGLSLDELLKELIKIMRETFPKNLVIESSIQEELWPVLGDWTQLHQVLLNLCVNARDAMPNGGKLSLRASNITLDHTYASMLPEANPGNYLRVEVEDTGCGISPENQERIFDPFFTTKGVGSGTGLGLSTVLGIVKSHGGFIQMQSEPGKGTTFQIYLPASQREVHSSKETRAVLPKANGELLLVVDDESNVREVARIILQKAGYRVLLAADGTEGLAVYTMNAGSVAGVLTDLMMPFMDGIAFIRALRSLNPEIPIIASTGLGERTQVAQLQELEVKTILTKPYTSEALLQTVSGALHPSCNTP